MDKIISVFFANEKRMEVWKAVDIDTPNGTSLRYNIGVLRRKDTDYREIIGDAKRALTGRNSDEIEGFLNLQITVGKGQNLPILEGGRDAQINTFEVVALIREDFVKKCKAENISKISALKYWRRKDFDKEITEKLNEDAFIIQPQTQRF